MAGRARVAAALAVVLVAQLLVAMPASAAADPKPASRLSGTDRIATAVAVSQAQWTSADDAVLATGADFPDALAAGGLAATVGGPLLLTWRDRLPDPVTAELQRLGVRRVWIVGGRAAVGATVEQSLAARGFEIRRLSGGDRFATAAAVAAAVGRGSAQEVLVALGAHDDPRRAWPDALAAGAFAALGTVPPLLLSLTGTLPAGTRDALQPGPVVAGPGAGVHVIGGTGAVSPAVAATLDALAGDVTRHAGPNRFATSLAVATQVLGRLDATPRPLIIASGANFPDGLTAAGLAAKVGGVLVLVPPGSIAQAPELEQWLTTNRDRFSSLLVIGGPRAVSDAVMQQLGTALGASPGATPPPGGTTPPPGGTTPPPGGTTPPPGGTTPPPGGTTPVPGALEVTLSAPAQVPTNDVFTYEVAVRNTGDTTVQAVEVALDLPVLGALIASTPAATDSDGTLVLPVGDVPAGAEVLATVRWAAPSSSALLSSAVRARPPHTSGEPVEALTQVLDSSDASGMDVEAHSDTNFVSDPEFLEEILTGGWCYPTAPAGSAPPLAQARTALHAWLIEQVGAAQLAEFLADVDVSDPERVDAAAASALMANSPAAAAAILLAAHEREPRNPNPLVSLAPLATMLGFAQEALAFLDAAEATGIRPLGVAGVDGRAAAANNRGHALLAMGQWGAAEAPLRQALGYSPELADAKRNLSKSLLCQGNQSAAIDAFIDGSYRSAPDEVVVSEGLGSRPTIPDVHDLGQGVDYELDPIPYAHTADDAAELHAVYRDMQQTQLARIMAHNDEKQQLWGQQDTSKSSATRGRLYDVSSTVGTISDETDLQEEWEAVLAAEKAIDDSSREFWSELTAGEGGRFEHWGCDEQKRASTAAAARARFQQWRPQMADLDAAMRAYASAAYPYMTAVAAGVADPVEHRLVSIQIEQTVDVWYYTQLVSRALNESFYQSIWKACFEPPAEQHETPEEPQAPPPAPECSDDQQRLGVEIDLGVASVSANCENVALEASFKLKRMPGLSYFASVDYAHRSGVMTVFGGGQMGGGFIGPSAKAGLFMEVEAGARVDIRDVGLRLQTTVDAGKGVKLNLWEGSATISYRTLFTGQSDYLSWR